MVAEKQQERHTNDKKRKFRRPFQRSPTNGAQKSSIGKEKDKIHNRYISTNANTGGGLHDNHVNGNISKNSKDVNESSHEIVNSHSGSNDHTSNNESRLNSNRHTNNGSGSNKNFSNNNGGVKDQYYGARRDSSEKCNNSTVANTGAYITGNGDNSKPSHAKNNKPEKIQPNHQQQNHQKQQQQQQHQQGQNSNQHSKQVNQRQIPSNFQQKHQTYSSSNHNGHHEGRYGQDRRGRGYGYSGNRQHNHGGSSGGYDLNRKQFPPSSSSVGGIGGNSHNSQSRPNHHNRSQHLQTGSSNTSTVENAGNTSLTVTVVSTTTNPTSTTAVPPTVNAANTTNLAAPTTTAKEEGGKHYSSQNNNGLGISRKDFHGTPNKRGGDSHYYGHGRQHGTREHSNYHQHKDNIGKGAPHGGHQKDKNDVPPKESRTTSHKSFANGKPGAGAATTVTTIGSELEQNFAANTGQRHKIQSLNQQQSQAQSQKPSHSIQGNSSDTNPEHRDFAKGDSGGHKGNFEHNQNSNVVTKGHANQHNSHNLSNSNGGGSWKNQNGGDHTYGRHGRYSGPKNMGKGSSACNGGPGQSSVFPKHSTEGGGTHLYGQGALGGPLLEDLKKKKSKKRFNKNMRNGSNPSGVISGNQTSGSHQVSGNAKERLKYGPGEQQKTHSAGEAFSSALPNENESRNISNKAQGGVTQNPSSIEVNSEKGKAIDSRKKLSGSSNDSENIVSGETTIGSDSMNGKLFSQESECLGRNGKSTDFKVNANATNCTGVNDVNETENADPIMTRDIERREKLGSAIPVSEAKEGSSCHSGGNNNGNSATPISSSSSSTNNSSSTGGGGMVGPWRRNLHGGQGVDSLETVRRAVKSLLNKITVEKFTVIAEKLAVCIDEIKNVDELEELVKQVLEKAITEPDFSEMYADLCQILKWRSPVLVNRDGKSTIGFSRALLARCEQEFKNMPRNMTPTDEEREKYDSEELAILYRKRKLHVLGIIRLIGELFIRKMFPMRSLNELVFDLVMIQESPDEYAIECLCQLIMTTGYYLDSNEKSQMIVDQWFGRLRELQNTSISTRLNCLIQDVFDLRKHKWVKKVHKQKAKALADILKDIDVEDVLGGAAIAAQYGSVVVVGERSNLVGNSAYYNYMTSQEELYISKQKGLQKQ
ncbi:eIF4G eukaryotic initiation factor 4 [Cryptosporidium sp. chipmunk genotype I]|uniref:eIF4G eukaryotic initiation factor 4 n=1 Tax=Cryptosporidium sp. chipmunk genotype I TaxID=1280935 RepID=UPI00351A47D8|nr:eIF4G eukaryotic initiation factor 4 [Cryptosporidium sp. chipmunk genotype I]